MKKILFIFVLMSSCSFIPSDPTEMMTSKNNFSLTIEEQDRKYPYFNIDFGGFVVKDMSPIKDKMGTPQQEYEARRLTIKEKTLVLQNLSFLRFALNTPEFASNLLKSQFYSSRDVTGVRGTLKKCDPLDSKRLLEIIQKRSYRLTICKERLNPNAAAVGTLGASIYVMDDADPHTHNAYGIAFPNAKNWNEHKAEAYWASILLHEALHNSGFNHEITKRDAVYGIQEDVFMKTVTDPAWQQKYQRQIANYRSYYGQKYGEWLVDVTVPTTKKIRTRRDLAYRRVLKKEITVCVLDENGNFVMKKKLVDQSEFL